MININQELHQNFLDFSYEANSQRAFADARDGLKPGQRACLWEMYNKGYSSKKPHVKSAKISGGVIANWWPHGSTAIYDTFARMSQSWINNIPEVGWHGANGSIQISGEAAADRYTEARLSPAAEDGLLLNINKNNVDMKLNFSEDAEWPEVFPAIYPRLMVNGCQGIGSTIANVWLPHNLNELVTLINSYVSTGTLDYSKLAPDFPTGGIIINKDDLSVIYQTGKGKVTVRAYAEIKDNSIIISEIPYQVYVEPLIEDIKKLVADGTIPDIEDIYNKSGKSKLCIEIVCENNPLKTLHLLYKYTDLQKSYSANQFALVGKTPKLLTLKEYLDIYIAHNLQCIQREYQFDLKKAQDRLEITSGLVKALEDIDNIIALIKKSESSSQAVTNLIHTYQFTERQAKAIVDMKLGRLARLEKIELEKEIAELKEKIANCLAIVNDVNKRQEIFLNRLNDFNKKYSTTRKTKLTQVVEGKSDEEKKIAMIPPEKCVVVLTESGNIKRIPATSFKAQRRAGKGVKTQDDITSMVLRTNTIDSLMIFTNCGNMYRLIVDDIPEGTNSSKGTPVKALVSMEVNEKPIVIYSIYRDTDAKFVIFVTKQGYVKRTSLDEYIGIKKKAGIKALNLHDEDEIATVFLANDENILILTKDGYGIRSKGSEFPASGRVTIGYKGINLREGDSVVAAMPIRDIQDDVAIFTKEGTARRIPLTNFPIQMRNGRGVISAKDTHTTAACLVSDGDLILIVGDKNSLCVKAEDIPVVSTKTAIGNIMIKGSSIISVSKV